MDGVALVLVVEQVFRLVLEVMWLVLEMLGLMLEVTVVVMEICLFQESEVGRKSVFCYRKN